MSSRQTHESRDPVESRGWGVLHPLIQVVLSISGPTLGVIVSKEHVGPAIIWAFFMPLSFLFLMYLLAFAFRPNILYSEATHLREKEIDALKAVVHAKNRKPTIAISPPESKSEALKKKAS